MGAAGRLNPSAMVRGGRQVIPRPAAWRIGDGAPWASSRHDGQRAVELAPLLASVAERRPQTTVPTFPDARSSAVLVLLHDGDAGPEALFTRRSAALRNHAGEISFPGGRVDPGETSVDAALREAHEEVGLDPALVQVHGELDHLSTVVSRSHIVPVVGTVEARPPLTPAEAEVERILWVPLAELSQPDVFREEWWGTPPLDRPLYFFELEDETIWGATARMLHQLLRLAHGVDGPEPPAW